MTHSVLHWTVFNPRIRYVDSHCLSDKVIYLEMNVKILQRVKHLYMCTVNKTLSNIFEFKIFLLEIYN